MTKHSDNVNKAIKALDSVSGGQAQFADAITAIVQGPTWESEIQDLVETVYASCVEDYKGSDRNPGQHPKFLSCRQMIRKYSAKALGDDNQVTLKQSKDKATGKVSFKSQLSKVGKRSDAGQAKTPKGPNGEPVVLTVELAMQTIKDKLYTLSKDGRKVDANALHQRIANMMISAIDSGNKAHAANVPTSAAA